MGFGSRSREIHFGADGVARELAAMPPTSAAQTVPESTWSANSRIPSAASARRPWVRTGAKPINFALLAERLNALIQAGLSPSEALAALEGQATGLERNALLRVRLALSSGVSLAGAIKALPGAPLLLVELIRASERTSDLPAALSEYADYTARESELRHRIVSASIYPAVLLLVGLAVLAFLLLVVMPRFSGVYASLRGPLPWTVSLILAWSAWAKHYGGWALVAGLGVFGTTFLAARTQRFRSWLFDQATRAEVIGRLWRQYHLARLYRTLGMLLSGGLNFPQALRLARGLMPAPLSLAVSRALDAILTGQSPAASFEAAGLSTPVASPLMRVAERTGQMPALLRKAAQYHDQDVTRTLERTMKAAEPILMALIGVAIGAVVVLMYAPIFELAQVLR